MEGLFTRLRGLDAYPKTLEDFRVRTSSGAVITAVAVSIALWLFVGELRYFLSHEVVPELSVDAAREGQLRVNLDVVFHNIPCTYLGIDAMDMTGQHQFGVEHTVFKKRLGRDGAPLPDTPVRQEVLESGRSPEQSKTADLAAAKGPGYCGSCYGSEQREGQCCNSCEEVQESYRQKGWAFTNTDGIEQCVAEGWKEKMASMVGEGCQVYGYISVNKVQGNFHFAPGKSFQQHHMHVHDLQPLKDFKFTMAHTVNRLSFGRDYPGIINPLDQTSKRDEANGIAGMYQYFIKVVPTEYRALSGELIDTNQFSVTEHFKQLHQEGQAPQNGQPHGPNDHGLPGVFFMYDISPIKVTYVEKARSFAHFLTGVCAIIGGVFTVAGLIDSAVYHGARTLKAKVDLGKSG